MNMSHVTINESCHIWMSHVTQLVHTDTLICDTTRWCVTWLIHVTHWCVTWLSHVTQLVHTDTLICDMTHWCVTCDMWHDSLMCDMWVMSHNSCTLTRWYVTRLLHMQHTAIHCNTLQHTDTLICDMTPSYTPQDADNMHISYKVVKTHSMPCLHRSFPVKEPYN